MTAKIAEEPSTAIGDGKNFPKDCNRNPRNINSSQTGAHNDNRMKYSTFGIYSPLPKPHSQSNAYDIASRKLYNDVIRWKLYIFRKPNLKTKEGLRRTVFRLFCSERTVICVPKQSTMGMQMHEMASVIHQRPFHRCGKISLFLNGLNFFKVLPIITTVAQSIEKSKKSVKAA